MTKKGYDLEGPGSNTPATSSVPDPEIDRRRTQLVRELYRTMTLAVDAEKGGNPSYANTFRVGLNMEAARLERKS